jgi:hypothetical protein
MRDLIDLGVPALCLVFLIYLAIKIQGSDGPSQDKRLKKLEKSDEDKERRLGAVERNVSGLFRGLSDSMDALTRELHIVAAALPRVADVENRETLSEHRLDSHEERLQFIVENGCGHPECPHRTAVAPPETEG